MHINRLNSLRYGLAVLGLISLTLGCQSNTSDPIIIREAQAAIRPSELLSVTSTYGPLNVRVGETDGRADRKPWSSWWYPADSTYLFEGTEGHLSPLEKYDQYMTQVRGTPKHAAEFERLHLYEPNADSWEGLCDAWSVASIMENEPRNPVIQGNTRFEVGDLKALLIKTYEKHPGLKIYGQRNNGDQYTIHGDIFPDQFHRFVQAELIEQNHAFIMDKDPGIAVWNTPVFQASIKVTPGDSPQTVHVSTWLKGADPHVDSYDFVGTREVVFEYTYDLTGQVQADGSLLVLGGAWTGDSVSDHPDFVTAVPTTAISTESRNTEIDGEAVRSLIVL